MMWHIKMQLYGLSYTLGRMYGVSQKLDIHVGPRPY